MSKECESCNDKSCAVKGGGNIPPENRNEEIKIAQRLCKIKNKIVVLSGKGGVGKSTVAVNLASAMAKAGIRTGLLDVDIHGPSVPTMLGVKEQAIRAGEENVMYPAETDYGLKVMSVAFFLPKGNEALIWRGPMKTGVIKQFVRDVEWGELDYLFIDCPPGTGDEPLSVVQMLKKPTGGIIVTTPQDVVIEAVRKSISFCRTVNLPILGIIENMSGYICPHCGQESNPFSNEGGKKLAEEENVAFLGSIPLSADVTPSGDQGNPLSLSNENPVGKTYRFIADKLQKSLS